MKSPAVSTQLKTALIKITELEKKLKEESTWKDNYHNSEKKVMGDLEQIHALLDVLPNTAGRKTSEEESWQRKDITVMTRLASYLAHR